MKRIFMFLAIILIVILFLGRNYYSINAKGFMNFKRCRGLKSPVSRSRLIENLGNPVRIEDEGNQMKLIFETPSIMSGHITALVDRKTDLTFCIKCSEDCQCQ